MSKGHHGWKPEETRKLLGIYRREGIRVSSAAKKMGRPTSTVYDYTTKLLWQGTIRPTVMLDFAALGYVSQCIFIARTPHNPKRVGEWISTTQCVNTAHRGERPNDPQEVWIIETLCRRVSEQKRVWRELAALFKSVDKIMVGQPVLREQVLIPAEGENGQ